MHWTDTDALAAADAMGVRFLAVVLLGEDDDGVRPLDDRHGHIKLRHAHHRATGQDLIRILPNAAGLQQLRKRRADADFKIRRLATPLPVTVTIRRISGIPS